MQTEALNSQSSDIMDIPELLSHNRCFSPMEKILQQIRTPEWWFSVVFVGILVGLAASYARGWISFGAALVSHHLKEYFKREAEKDEQRVARFVSNPTLLAAAHSHLTKLAVWYCFFML